MRFLRFLSISFLCCALLVPLLFCFVQIKTAALPQTPAPTTPAPGTSAKAMALFDATSGTFRRVVKFCMKKMQMPRC